MRFCLVALVICACGRLHFETDETQLAITSPAQNAQVGATATLDGTCRPGFPIAITGDVVAGDATCDDGTFSVEVMFSDGDGVKTVTISQGTSSVVRSFVRVTPGLRAASGNTKGAAGPMVDCDLTIAAPAGVAARDLIVGVIYTDGGLQGAIGTLGWTRLALSTPTSVAFYKFATENEPASYTFRVDAGTAVTDTCEAAGALAAFKGVQLVESILAESAKVDANTSLVAPSVNATESALLVVVYGSNGPAAGITMPTDLANAQAVRSPDDFANAAIGYRSVDVGPTGDRTGTIPVPRDVAAGQILLDVTP